MVCCSAEYYLNIIHPQCLDVTSRKLASVDVRSSSSDMNAIDRREVFRGPSFGIVKMLLQYYVSVSTAAIMASSLAAVRTVCGRQGIYVCRRHYTSCLTETLLN